jgi:multicomponent K+:H+ antiporter subunit D
VISFLHHLPVLPIVIPLVSGAVMLLFAESQRRWRDSIALLATLAQLAVAIVLMYFTTDAVPDIWHKGIGVYSISAWPAPYGIVLVVDRLSALLLMLNAVLALPAIVYSIARWERVGVHYQPLVQFLLMGLNGAFLTGDLFNLFVFFEVLLAASYGLILHGSGAARVKAGMHYIVVNLVGSLLFLIGVALIYGIAGTLNRADLGVRWSTIAAQDRGLFDAGVAVLAIAFLIKAGSWPLNFWLPSAYSSAGAPVAAIFAIMTKVGIYAVLRMSVLLGDAAAPAPLNGPWLFYGGIATLIFGIVGILASQQLGRLIAFTVIVSSGTMLAAVGCGAQSLTAPALFYMVSSVLASAAFFMLTGMTERTRMRQVSDDADVAPLPAVSYQAFDTGDVPETPGPDEEVGIAIPAAMAFLGLAFVFCVLLVCGLPPLSGFVGKFALLSSIVDARSRGMLPPTAWLFLVALLAAGLAGLIALTRIGIRLFWTITERTTPRLRVIEAAPVAFLLLLTMALTAYAGPVMTYMQSAARTLHDPQMYIEAVLSQDAPTTAQVPAPPETLP